MKRLLIAMALAVSGCATPVPQNPGSIANTTVLDEQVATGFELAYTAAALAATNARKAGLISDAKWPQVKELDNRAHSALQAVRSAYRAGNASNYAAAAIEAQAAISGMLGAIR